MVNVLITGGTGFLGRHVIGRLLPMEVDYCYAARSLRVDDPSPSDGGRFVACDLRAANAVHSLISSCAPSHIIHVAGSYGPGVPEEDLHRDVSMLRNIFSAVERLKPIAKVVIVSSASIYGRPQFLPVTEGHPCSPLSPYGRCKLDQELVAVEASRARGIPTCIARCFNVTGPGESPRLVIGRVASEMAKLEREGGGEIRVGNLSNRRDVMDVRDAANAIVMLALRPCAREDQSEVFNVCSGRSVPMSELVGSLLSKARKPITLRSDCTFHHGATDVEDIFGSNRKLAATTNWKPEISLEESLEQTLICLRGEARAPAHVQ